MRIHPNVTRCAVAWLAGIALAQGVAAQPAADRFPAAVVDFLALELPQMEAAIAERDRQYFEDAMARTVDFSQQWGFKTQANPSLARYPMCTAAVSDFVIVGLCRTAPSLDGCEPGLAARFDANLRRCREIAGAR